MKHKIGLAFMAAAIGFVMIALAQARIGQGHTQASAGPAFQVLQPVFSPADSAAACIAPGPNPTPSELAHIEKQYSAYVAAQAEFDRAQREELKKRQIEEARLPVSNLKSRCRPRGQRLQT